MIAYTRRMAPYFETIGLTEFYAEQDRQVRKCVIKSGCGKVVKILPFSIPSKAKREDVDYAVEQTAKILKEYADKLIAFKKFRKQQKDFLDKSAKLPDGWLSDGYNRIQFRLSDGSYMYVQQDADNLKAVISNSSVEQAVNLLAEYEQRKSDLQLYFNDRKTIQQHIAVENIMLNDLKVCTL